MNHFNPQPEIAPKVLATDLDGTFIPLPRSAANTTSLRIISEHHLTDTFRLIFATGRHFESVLDAISEYNLPTPEWIICDVGSAIYKRHGDQFTHYTPYETHLLERSGQVNREEIEALLSQLAGLELQSADHQQRFKISYQCAPELTDSFSQEIRKVLSAHSLPYDCLESIDPFENRGLIDILPAKVSKAYALIWLATHADFKPDEVIYSGDSGNDLAALICGFRAIIVGNASNALKAQVSDALSKRGLSDRLHIAAGEATSGVLEGCQKFGLLS